MEPRRRTWFDDRGLRIAGRSPDEPARHLPFYAGAMHYWRVEPARWGACLAALHDLGLTLVETYVPWRVHEPAPGRYDFTGANDLGRFLTAAHAAGLGVVLRPGPHVNAELTSFGFPDHVLADPDLGARTSHDTPAWLPVPPRAFPIPSYASARFHELVAGWYRAVAEVVRPHLAPDGPVVAIGVDNEAQHFFRAGAFDLDYHPDAIQWWRDATGDAGEPPRRWAPADAARCLAWVRAKDQLLARALGMFARHLDDAGLGEVARFHNLPPGPLGLSDLRRIQHAIGGPVGVDAYTPRAGFAEVRRRATAVLGDADPLPLALEVGVGFFPWFPPLDAADDPTRERDHLLNLLAGGVRGFNLFMAVERDRYYGAAIDRRGAIEPHARWIPILLRTLGELAWPTLRRPAPLALIAPRADARVGLAAAPLDPAAPALTWALGLGDLGDDPGVVVARRWQVAIPRALELAGVPYVIVDEAITEDELARFRAIVCPTGERIDRGLWHRLRATAEHRRAVVVIGPTTPTRDELDQPLVDRDPPRRMGRIRAGSLDDLPGLAGDLAGLVGEAPTAWLVERPEDVVATPFVDPAGATRAVIITSDVPRPVGAVLLVEPGCTLRDPFGGEPPRITDDRATIALPPRGARLLVVDR